MSGIGPKRTSLVAPQMSAFRGKADMTISQRPERAFFLKTGVISSRERKGSGANSSPKVAGKLVAVAEREDAAILAKLFTQLPFQVHYFLSLQVSLRTFAPGRNNVRFWVQSGHGSEGFYFCF
jgi:hypothetical protein